MNGYKGVIVVDVKESPLWRAAMSHSQKHNVDIISAMDHPSPRSLVRAISGLEPDFVIFSWRGALDGIFQSRYSRKRLLSLDPSIYLLIPDFLGVENFSKEEQHRLDMCDGILVTSRQLKSEYQNRYQVNEIELLHDLPDLKLLEEVRDEIDHRVRKRIIWIGNSKWGRRAGYRDHKGLLKYVLPVKSLLTANFEGIDFKIIDSAKGKIPYAEVLEEIRKSCCLIVTSKSEGTSLPILEAAALGTPVVSFDVGIASEILILGLRYQIVPRDLDILTKKIAQTLNEFENLSVSIQTRFEEYRFEVADDMSKVCLSQKRNGGWRTNRSKYKFFDSLKWIYRWLNH